MTPEEELRHLRHGPAPAERPVAGLVTYTVRADDPAGVVGRAVEVLVVVLEQSAQSWPGLDHWRRALPWWFVEGSAPTRSAQEDADWLSWWRTLDPAARAAAERARGWTLGEWLFWLEPAERQWFWWDARQRTDGAEVRVVVLGWPYADGALRRLLEVAGAAEVDVE